MKSRWPLFVCVGVLASALCAIALGSTGAADKSSATTRSSATTGSSAAALRQDPPAGGQAVAQEKPYTKEDPGPWPAVVADKHSPQIMYEKTNVGLKVTVKIDNHPMDAIKPHYIMWIRLEDGSGHKLGEKIFQPTDPAPIASFDLTSVPDKLKAFEQCNIHGIWMSQVDVEKK